MMVVVTFVGVRHLNDVSIIAVANIFTVKVCQVLIFGQRATRKSLGYSIGVPRQDSYCYLQYGR